MPGQPRSLGRLTCTWQPSSIQLLSSQPATALLFPQSRKPCFSHGELLPTIQPNLPLWSLSAFALAAFSSWRALCLFCLLKLYFLFNLQLNYLLLWFSDVNPVLLSLPVTYCDCGTHLRWAKVFDLFIVLQTFIKQAAHAKAVTGRKTGALSTPFEVPDHRGVQRHTEAITERVTTLVRATGLGRCTEKSESGEPERAS